MSTAPTLTDAQIDSWTPEQQLETLSRLASAVMARRKDRCLAIPPCVPGQSAEGYFLTGYPVGRVTSFSPVPDDTDLRERNRLAADPRNRLSMSGDIVDQIAD